MMAMSPASTLRVVDIVDGTIVDGPGLRTSIYLAGCLHSCPGCHNESTWAFDAGHDMSVKEIEDHVRENDFNVTFSGGDPLYQPAALIEACKAIRALGKSIWCYTGFTYEQVCASPSMRPVLDMIDVLVDGPFIKELRDTSLRFRGSANQRIIDVRASLALGGIVVLQVD